MAFVPPRNLFVRLQPYNESPRFGKGVLSLMTLISQGESMRAACRATGIAYSKAFKLIKSAESDLGFKLIDGTSGGAGGGGSRITEEGLELLRRYYNFEKSARQALDALFKENFGV